ncbi:putative MAPEG superfamily protein [Skermanella aerolata]|uniref:MAPEG family protein n=1 Tax=Skermanella aerolata TaxID=393310 RepID=UPI003D1BBB18
MARQGRFDRRYLFSFGGVVIGTVLAWGLLFAFWPAASAFVGNAGDRLALAAGLLVWPALLLLVMVFAVALARLASAAFDPLNDPESGFQRRAQRALTNSVEQTTIFVPALLAAAVLADPADVRFAGVMTALFCAGRILFWAGYVVNAYYRAPGMIMTLNINIAVVAYAVYRAMQ